VVLGFLCDRHSFRRQDAGGTPKTPFDGEWRSRY
jgi:hypothetical protein